MCRQSSHKLYKIHICEIRLFITTTKLLQTYRYTSLAFQVSLISLTKKKMDINENIIYIFESNKDIQLEYNRKIQLVTFCAH